MTDEEAITMDQSECAEFLTGADTGVLSLPTPEEESPHSIPVSFGYDAVESVLYFRLVDGTGSEQESLDGRPVSFVVYDRDDETDRWRSVIVEGRLERTRNEDIALETLQGLERVTIPLVDIFGEPTSDLEFEFFRLVPDVLTGRKEVPRGP